MKSFRISLSSHGFKVDLIQDDRAMQAIRQYLQGCLQYGMVRHGKRFLRKIIKVFAASNSKRSYYRFHIGELDKFLEHMKEFGFNKTTYSVVQMKIYEPRYVDLPIKEGWIPREKQIPAIEYAADENNGPWGKIISMETGGGKGFCTMSALSRVGVFSIYILRPMYMDKWEKEILATYDIQEEELVTIQGSSELRKMLEAQKNKTFNAKVVVISNKTYQSWLRLFEAEGEKKFSKNWPCSPENFFEFMQAGFRVVDEVHQDFHFNFKLDSYTNVLNSVSLSATLISKDPFIRSRQQIAYPDKRRFKAGEPTKYIDASAYLFQFKHPEKIRVTEWGATTYSHLAVEESILKNKETKKNYFDMIATLVKVDFLRIRDEGEKFAVYCARIEMCKELRDYLKQVYPDLDIRTYVGSGDDKDPYENLIEATGRITTYGSAGTAQDIPKLRTNIVTVSMESIQGNIQLLGRTRVMDSGNTPRFVYLAAENIPKQMGHHKERMSILNQRARSFRVRWHDKPI